MITLYHCAAARSFPAPAPQAAPSGAHDLVSQACAMAIQDAVAYLRNADDGGAIGLLHAVTSPLASVKSSPGTMPVPVSRIAP